MNESSDPALPARVFSQRIFLNSVFFMCGFSLVFMVLGIAASGIGQFLARNRFLLQRAGGIFFVFMGIYVMELVRIPFLYKQFTFGGQKTMRRIEGVHSFLAGMTFGFGWTPCVGPLLATILFFVSAASAGAGFWSGMWLLSLFTLGLAIPFLIISAGMGFFIQRIRVLLKYAAILQKFSGALILLMGLLLITNEWSAVLGKTIALIGIPDILLDFGGDGRVTFIIAFLGGLLTFFSPCILPVLPAYVGYIGGMALNVKQDGQKGG